MENWLRKKSEAEIEEQKKTVHLYKDLLEEESADEVALLRKVRAEKVSLPELQNQVHEKVSFVMEKLVKTSPVIGTGYDGIVFKIDPAELTENEKNLLQDDGATLPSQESALKILKIYNSIAGEAEFLIQKEAYEILKDSSDTAKIPEPLFLRDQKINEETKQYLNRKGANLSTDVEAIAMDFIEGKDLSTVFFEFVLSHSGYEPDYIEAMTVQQKYSEVANLLGFLRQSDEYREGNVARMNESKLVAFLKKNDFKLDSEIIRKIENAMRILKENNIFHNDLHGRNIRIADSGEVYIIDFGRASRETSTEENTMFLNKWKSLLNESIEEKNSEALNVENLRLKIRETASFPGRVSDLKQKIESGRLAAALRVVGSDALQTDLMLATLKEISLNEPSLSLGIKESLESITTKDYPYLVNKLKNLLKSGYFSS